MRLSGPLELDGMRAGREMKVFQVNLRQHFDAGDCTNTAQLLGHPPHTADGHFPLAGPVTDQVIKKTTVLQQRFVMWMSENADFGVSEHQSAHQIILQVAFDGKAQRFFDERAPGLTREVVFRELPCQSVFAWEWLEHGIPNLISEDPREAVEFLHSRKFGVTAGQFQKRLASDGPGNVAHDKSFMSAITRVRRESGRSARPQLKPQSQIVNDLFRKQAYEIGIAGEVGVVI